MRSAFVSPVPIMNVAVDSTPRPCAVSMISSHRSPDSLSGAIALRGRSTRISAPAPANESRPAAWIRVMASATLTFDTFAMCATSLAPSEWSASCGYSLRIAANVVS